MKKIDINTQKKIQIEMLKYIHKVCKENNIKYTLIAGSLIGAIRHKGMIPWDDDIDIILMRDEYQKLIKVLKESNHPKYKLMYDEPDYYYPFPKLVDTTTTLKEGTLRKIEGYGLFIDIFEYHYIPNNKLLQKFHYKMLNLKKKFINGWFYEFIPNNIDHKLLRKIRRVISNKLGSKKILEIYKKECNKMKKKTNYVLSNWNAYSFEKDVQLAKNFEEYIEVDFDGIKAMITKNYDKVLRTTFGDYMQLPPKEERKTHNLEAYWRNK